jgi:hypothetical protein
MTQVLSFNGRFFLRCVNRQLYLGRHRARGFPRNLGLYVRSDLLAVHSDGLLFAFADDDSRTLFVCRITCGNSFTEVGRISDFDARRYSRLEWDDARGALLALHPSEGGMGTRCRYETVWLAEPALVA